MSNKLTQKQKTFCIKYFELGNASEAARIAKYSPKTAAVIGRQNLLKLNIQAYLNELNQKVEDESLAKVLERKKRLTVFIREDNYNKFGINRQSNIQAITELNKMEHIYEEKSSVVDNRTINVIVNSEDGKEIIERLASGERTDKE